MSGLDGRIQLLQWQQCGRPQAQVLVPLLLNWLSNVNNHESEM